MVLEGRGVGGMEIEGSMGTGYLEEGGVRVFSVSLHFNNFLICILFYTLTDY